MVGGPTGDCVGDPLGLLSAMLFAGGLRIKLRLYVSTYVYIRNIRCPFSVSL